MTRRSRLLAGVAGLAAALAAVPAAEPAPAGTTATVQDMVYFAKSGPVRVRFRVALAGAAPEAAWQAAVDKLFTFCDRDGNGALDAKERAAFMKPGRRPRPVDPDLDGGPGVEQQVFSEKDPPADRAAFAAKLRAAGLGPVAVTVQPGTTDPERYTAALFRHLDRDGDGKLSADELAAAPDRLAALDLNEDELIAGPELLGRPVPAPAGLLRVAAPREADDEPAPVGDGDLLPLPGGSAAAVKALLAARDKDKNGALGRPEFGAGPAAFAALDKDGNGQLDTDELAAWLRQLPDAEFAVSLGGPSPAIGPGAEADGSVTRMVAHARVRVVAPPAAPAEAWRQTAERLRAEFDRVARGGTAVERKDLDGPRDRAFLPLFDLADRNADKKLTRDEFDTALAAAGAAASCRVEIAVMDRGRGLFELLDKNGDGQLSPRELKAAAGLARSLDRNADGRVDRADIPRLFAVAVAPAGITLINTPLAVGGRFAITAPAAAAGDVPAWFSKMDRNGDGDVSRREFLGPAELFRKLDRDGDGLISPDEARAAK